MLLLLNNKKGKNKFIFLLTSLLKLMFHISTGIEKCQMIPSHTSVDTSHMGNKEEAYSKTQIHNKEASGINKENH